MLVKNELVLIGCAALGVYLVGKYVIGNAGDLAQAGVKVAGDVAVGAVIGTGEILGIPPTNETECQKALREGRTWDASFACPAGTFLGSLNPF